MTKDASQVGRVFEARLESLQSATKASSMDAFVATSPASIFYLTGWDAMQFERLCAVVAPVHADGFLLVPELESDAAHASPTMLDKVVYSPEHDGFEQLKDVLPAPCTLGVEEAHLTLARAMRLQEIGYLTRPATAILHELRGRKDQHELQAIRHACDVIGNAMERMFASVRNGDVERAVNAEVALELAKAGATESHPLVLFGSNAANPHGKPGDRALQEGDVICADISARIDGYWGDVTRCATVGPASDWAKGAWTVVRDAQTAAIAACTSGTPAGEVDTAQRLIVEASADLGRCLHGAGHAMGVEIHEPPFLVPRETQALEPGFVLTVEPGLYATDVGGIRLEDDVAVTDGDPIMLSSLPLDLRELPA